MDVYKAVYSRRMGGVHETSPDCRGRVVCVHWEHVWCERGTDFDVELVSNALPDIGYVLTAV